MPQISIDARPSAWPHDGYLEPSETALLIIDMQRDFCDEGGYIASMGYDVSPARKIIPNVRRVRDAVAAWGGSIVQTREGHRPDLSDLPPIKAWRSRLGGVEVGAQGPLGKVLVRGEAGWEIVPELAPQPGEIIVDKPGYSAFYATDLERILIAKRVPPSDFYRRHHGCLRAFHAAQRSRPWLRMRAGRRRMRGNRYREPSRRREYHYDRGRHFRRCHHHSRNLFSSSRRRVATGLIITKNASTTTFSFEPLS